MVGEAQIQPKESARGVRRALRKEKVKGSLWVARPSASISAEDMNKQEKEPRYA